VEPSAGMRTQLEERARSAGVNNLRLLPVGWERIHELWYNYVRGRNPQESFGIYDTVRHDTIWLDKA